MNTIVTALAALARGRSLGERGATATEYALLIVLVAIAILTGVGLFGTSLDALLTSAASSV